MRRILIIAIPLILCTVAALAGWQYWQYRTFLHTPVSVPNDGVVFDISPGSSVRAIAANLAEQGVITKPRYFSLYARLSKTANKVRAGEYVIEVGQTPVQLMDLFISGKVRQYSLTLLEGWNFREVMQAINQSEVLTHTLNGLEQGAIMKRLGLPDEHPEGRFYPDTYHFPRGLSDVDFLRRAYRAMHDRLTQEWEGRAEGLPLQSAYEALILASIVEKETGQPSERQAIAGVFIRRLNKGMRLQTDPTVIYGLGESFDGNIRRADLSSDTPYNTYTRKGLPPTPIAMPGGDAIHAAVHPDAGDALYFVAKGDGSHYFSATLQEHNNAVIKYQLKGRKRAFSSSP